MKGSFIYVMIFGTALLHCLSSCNSVSAEMNSAKKSNWDLVWSDEFDKDGLPDMKKWSYDVGDACDKPAGCGWGNNELQYYTENRSENARVLDGHLIIELHSEKYESRDFTSARLVSKNKGDWKYGKFEIRAKVPDQLGVWSAIWMLSTDDKYHGWPHSGEIDIMENVGFDPDTIVGSAHTLTYHHSIGTHKNGTIYQPTASEEFHTYTLEWNEEQYTLSVNDKPYFTYVNEHTGFEAWPFDQRFHMIMNIAYGGDWGGRKGIDPDELPARMYVDYVRVYEKVNNSEE